ncbi:DUF1349 domain-containing protein [Georgenia muralis]|jgi:regulation of enolase protein 1 (concanavalin A-like superfamily)
MRGTREWLNPPADVVQHDDALTVTAEHGSDFWRETLYGFTRDSGHALLVPVEPSGSLEVSFFVSFDGRYDQAGLMLRNDAAHWIKAGVEITDGAPHVGAVVTHGRSDWSLAPVPEWAGREVTVRASWAAGAVTLRARPDGEAWRTIRVAPFEVGAATGAGLYLCAPERAGTVVTFTGVRHGKPDTDLHEDPPTA